MERLNQDLVNQHISDFITVIEEGSRFVWLFSEKTPNRPVNWSTRSTFPTYKDAMETGIAFIKHTRPDLVKQAVSEAIEGVKYRNKQKPQ